MTTSETVLIVDDEQPIRKLIRSKLSAEGYNCEEAGDAGLALEKLNSSVALVLLDIKMPGKSGIELLPQIKTRQPDTAVIMATATTDVAIALNCIREGAYDFITKPFNLDELVLSVSRAFEKRRLELENRDYQLHLEQKVEEQAKKIRASMLNAITALAFALEAKDRYTSGHSQRVSELSVAIARELGISKEDIERVRLAGLIHDIGKIGVSEVLLNKPGKLSDEEFKHMKEHPGMGAYILAPTIEDAEILKIVRHHHERYDGTSYPDGLAGQQIPFGARILAVADSYDAMTSERPYRQMISGEMACAEIGRCRGTQFDPAAADAFIKIMRLHSFIKK